MDVRHNWSTVKLSFSHESLASQLMERADSESLRIRRGENTVAFGFSEFGTAKRRLEPEGGGMQRRGIKPKGCDGPHRDKDAACMATHQDRGAIIIRTWFYGCRLRGRETGGPVKASVMRHATLLIHFWSILVCLSPNSCATQGFTR
ncbi:hypothetical protein DFJ58DRAFT_909712 [Suillus subalutaceus]|uniref:uncharacterized protein n=1 Tax=Suillus subalutaceus TaxID=48586 RepID=UPI001B86C7D3|nr:uncharacterized protein DFJ58DRAFT_909712 [Suillus subalutaceus]KAG1876407.1 hypothetical protein DFJ58DRAFT_909712 [Suillus subalutaceus]